MTSSPVIARDGTIYIMREPLYDSRGNIASGEAMLAISASGVKKWDFSVDAIGSVPRYAAGPSSVAALGEDDMIYFCGLDSRLHALRSDGTEEWTLDIPGSEQSAPVVSGDTVYIGTKRGRLHAISNTGKTKWACGGPEGRAGIPGVAQDGTVYVTFTGDSRDEVWAVRPDGTIKWRHVIRGDQIVGRPLAPGLAVGSNGTIYFGDMAGKLYALSSAGKKTWEANIDPLESSPALGADGTVYVVTSNTSAESLLCVISARGQVKWRFRVGGTSRSSPALDGNGTAYFGTDGRYSEEGSVGRTSEERFYAIGSDGKPRWSLQTKGPVVSSPAIGGDGTVYFASQDGKLYAVGER